MVLMFLVKNKQMHLYIVQKSHQIELYQSVSLHILCANCWLKIWQQNAVFYFSSWRENESVCSFEIWVPTSKWKKKSQTDWMQGFTQNITKMNLEIQNSLYGKENAVKSTVQWIRSVYYSLKTVNHTSNLV